MKRAGYVWRPCPANLLVDPVQSLPERLETSWRARRKSRTSTTSFTFVRRWEGFDQTLTPKGGRCSTKSKSGNLVPQGQF